MCVCVCVCVCVCYRDDSDEAGVVVVELELERAGGPSATMACWRYGTTSAYRREGHQQARGGGDTPRRLRRRRARAQAGPAGREPAPMRWWDGPCARGEPLRVSCTKQGAGLIVFVLEPGHGDGRRGASCCRRRWRLVSEEDGARKLAQPVRFGTCSVPRRMSIAGTKRSCSKQSAPLFSSQSAQTISPGLYTLLSCG